MPTSIQHSHLREAAILTRAVENVVRKLVRLLIGRISLTRLQEMLRLIFVQEAEAFLQRERPGKNVPMTKLALLTGLDTRTLGRVKEERVVMGSISEDSDFLKGFTPGFRVLDLWLNDPRFLDAHKGVPKHLALTGPEDSFESLVALAVPSRGLTHKTILERLVLNKMVVLEEENEIVKLRRGGIVFIGNDQLDMIDIGFASVANLISTVGHNIQNADDPQNRFFQRSCWTYKLHPDRRREFRREMQQFLERSNRYAKSTIAPFEHPDGSNRNMTAGISMFYFEDERNESEGE